MTSPGRLGCEARRDHIDRRSVLAGCAVAAFAMRVPAARAEDNDDPARSELPKKGDRLVYFMGDNEGAEIKLGELKVGDEPVLAWPFDPAKKVPRDGSRLNLVLLVRLDPASLAPEAQALAAEGVVAFSAICTHQQCPVTEWLTQTQRFRCPCHQSEYDPRHEAAVVGGPAPRPLPALPLAFADGALQVAGPFTSRVGGEKPTG